MVDVSSKNWKFWVLLVLIVFIIVVIILSALLFWFFYPKPSDSYGGGGFMPPGQNYSWIDKECDCFGIEYDATPGLMDADHRYECKGLVYNCEFTKYMFNAEKNETSSYRLLPK